MANDYLRMVCRKCHALTRLYSYYPDLPRLAALDVRAFVDAHVRGCWAGDPDSIADVPPFEVHTDSSYQAAYGKIPAPAARSPDGGWREDPPEDPGLVAELERDYRSLRG